MPRIDSSNIKPGTVPKKRSTVATVTRQERHHKTAGPKAGVTGKDPLNEKPQPNRSCSASERCDRHARPSG